MSCAVGSAASSGEGERFFFHRRLFRDELPDTRDKFRIALLGALIPLFEPSALDPAAAAVRNIVRKLEVCEYGIEGAEFHRQIVHCRNGTLTDGVFEAILPLHANIRTRHVVQQRRKKGDVIRQAQPCTLPAGRADGLAQPAVERLVEHEILYEQIGQIVANVSEHALFSPVKSDLAVHLRERSARRAEGVFRALFEHVGKICLVCEQTLLLRLNGRKHVGDRLAHRRLESPYPLPSNSFSASATVQPLKDA